MRTEDNALRENDTDEAETEEEIGYCMSCGGIHLLFCGRSLSVTEQRLNRFQLFPVHKNLRILAAERVIDRDRFLQM